ncbi:heavy metal transporter [Microbacterium sp. lyk4-40-TSB-66]|uniref:heavy metal transporter n=1 Tax=Microbacterium sp. lyk4-40-TSB-66 TaxID=3040294 RepID=UPI002550603F|nr:heavy metal transporter [Microbacterium sp. lyk4-40-TSB-66]
MTDDPRPLPRVRVTASTAGRVSRPATRGFALPGREADEADEVFSRGLVRAQLRLALGCVAAFLVVAAALVGVIAALPTLGDPTVWSVPMSWLLHAYGFYPLILVFALIYARAAARNERRYRQLADPEDAV